MVDSPLHKELIVVGVDHTPGGTAALRWAVNEAARRGARVLSVHVYDVTDRADLAMEKDLDGARRQDRLRAQHQVLTTLGHHHNGPDVTVSVLDGPLVARLVGAAHDAVLLVVGKPQDGSHASLPRDLASASSCPVVVVEESGAAHVAERHDLSANLL